VAPRGNAVEGKSIGNISVMLVDDHAVVRMGFRLLLEGSADIKVVAESDSGEDACRKFPDLKPDVVVMDGSMPVATKAIAPFLREMRHKRTSNRRTLSFRMHAK